LRTGCRSVKKTRLHKIQDTLLLGAAYSRARESTCDRHGLACSGSPEGAAQALAALSAGAERWKQLDVKDYVSQANHSSGFWMSFHELIAGYPWLTKRAARVMDTKSPMPKRNGFAYLLAAFVPYAGRLGAGFGLLMLVYIVGVLAAVAIPAYQEYTVKAKLSAAIVGSQNVRETLGNYYQSNQKIPESLEILGISSQLVDGSQLTLEANTMVLTVKTKQGELIFTPRAEAGGRITWGCRNGEGIKSTQLPLTCRSAEN
jgi:Tfp pilus assembly major pilin PilA